MKIAFSTILLALTVAGSAAAQQPQARDELKQEVVMDASGRIVAPWTKGKTCKTDAAARETCRYVVIHPTTREIARVGDKWASKFVPTGNGQEIVRAETSLDKAIRTAANSGE